ncbi:hypothetical protein [Aneurinibacillus aneurinilyticus]|uniref:hypothetical protein n=1 Tax=Aneurinibacillus aneurinilyticus TaxID=1391 RepID=UPI0023F0A2B5|nr:hypothetical protein [Aneurinibacillus aneurinilyticus]
MKTIEKFPVVSPQGNEYLVRFRKRYGFADLYYVECRLYKRRDNRIIRWIFGDKLLFKWTIWEDRFSYEFIEEAKDIVLEYERRIADEYRKKDNERLFAEWDGIVREAK